MRSFDWSFKKTAWSPIGTIVLTSDLNAVAIRKNILTFWRESLDPNEMSRESWTVDGDRVELTFDMGWVPSCWEFE